MEGEDAFIFLQSLKFVLRPHLMIYDSTNLDNPKGNADVFNQSFP